MVVQCLLVILYFFNFKSIFKIYKKFPITEKSKFALFEDFEKITRVTTYFFIINHSYIVYQFTSTSQTSKANTC